LQKNLLLLDDYPATLQELLQESFAVVTVGIHTWSFRGHIRRQYKRGHHRVIEVRNRWWRGKILR
jgi:hypothetical protein